MALLGACADAVGPGARVTLSVTSTGVTPAGLLGYSYVITNTGDVPLWFPSCGVDIRPNFEIKVGGAVVDGISTICLYATAPQNPNPVLPGDSRTGVGALTLRAGASYVPYVVYARDGGAAATGRAYGPTLHAP